jgi:CRISPR-associated endonuclease/helicase Cas3
VVIVGVDDWAADPPAVARASRAVYGTHLLLRAAAQIHAIVESDEGNVVLPGDIARLVRSAYGAEPLGPPAWQEAMDSARMTAAAEQAAAAARARTFRLPAPRRTGSLVGWLDGSLGDVDETGSRAQVRDSDDAFEVLVVQRDGGDQWRLPDWLEGEYASLAGQPLSRREPLSPGLRRALAGTSVRLPAAMARGRRGDAVLEELESLVVEEWQRTPDLAGQLVLPLDQTRQSLVQGFRIRYDSDTGLSVDDLESAR